MKPDSFGTYFEQLYASRLTSTVWGATAMQESDFHEVADEFINLANELSEEWATPFLSAAFMYAAARYNTFFFFESDGAPDKQSAAIDYYCEQYRKMLQECMHDFRKNETGGGAIGEG